MMHYQQLQKKFDLTARVLFIAIGFSIPISISAYNVLSIAAVIFALLAGSFKEKFRLCINNQVILAALLFFALLVLSIGYTTAPWPDIMIALRKYDKLLFIFFLAPLLVERRWKLAGIYAFLAAMMVTLAISYMKKLGWLFIGDGGYNTIFTNHINTGFMMAFAAFILAHRCFDKVKFRWLYAVLLALTIYNLFFLGQGRTGYLVFLGLMGLFLWQKLAWKGVLACVIAVPLLLATMFFISPTFNNRIQMIFNDLHHYQDHQLYGNSIGLRVVFSKNSLDLMEHHPIIGTGVGSFKTEYLHNFPPDPGFTGMDNPQNEYLLIGVQLGAVGLAVFLWMLHAIWRAGEKFPPFMRYVAQGMVASFMIGCLCDSFLFLAITGYYFMFFSALFSMPCKLDQAVLEKNADRQLQQNLANNC